jgi:hypothetical protein
MIITNQNNMITGGDLSMEFLKDFAASAKKRSKGRINIKVFADPELVPGEQLFEATKKGTLDMLHHLTYFYWQDFFRRSDSRTDHSKSVHHSYNHQVPYSTGPGTQSHRDRYLENQVDLSLKNIVLPC